MNITVLGAGYVGLVSASCLAELGHTVTCLDTDAAKIGGLMDGAVPLYEPGLTALVKQNLRQRRLTFTTDWAAAVGGAAVIFIAVGTPSSRRGNGYADMSYVYEAARQIAPRLRDAAVIVNKSTVPVGTARHVEAVMREANSAAVFDVASNPEFLREGEALHDFLRPDRVVLGVASSHAEAVLTEVYRPLAANGIPLVVTTRETAELIKYAANAFLATKISFMNEMANLCETVGADVRDVSRGMGLDARIGMQFLRPGPGFGGSCFPKDTVALIRMAQEHGVPTRIVETVVEVNHAQKARMVRKIREAVGLDARGATLAVLGLTFKPETDDCREAPAFAILPPLLERGWTIRAHDPAGMEEARKVLPDLTYCADAYEACRGADAVCLMTEWQAYGALDLARVRTALARPIFIDLRNVFDPAAMQAAGLTYVAIGRPAEAVRA